MNRTLLGMPTPSSNTALEPLTNAMVADLPGVSAHFSRFPVTEISLRIRRSANSTTAKSWRPPGCLPMPASR